MLGQQPLKLKSVTRENHPDVESGAPLAGAVVGGVGGGILGAGGGIAGVAGGAVTAGGAGYRGLAGVANDLAGQAYRLTKLSLG